jgi:DNA polymerase III alpha subunit
MCQIKSLILHTDLLQKEEYKVRFEKEIELIEKLGQTDNILHAYEIKKIIEEFKVPFFIRGSAGSSLVLYMLGFSPIDPVKNGIVFERFINEYRDTLGDIDFDLPRTMRDNIMYKVYKTFLKRGIRIGRLCTRVYYRENSAIREILRRHNHRKTVPKNVMESKAELEYYTEKHNINYVDIIEEAQQLKGRLRYSSSHVGGITILKKDEDWMLTDSSVPLVNLDKNDIDSQKRFKIDLLSNSGLDIIREVCKDSTNLNFPYEQQVFDMIGLGDVIGLIYGESPLLKSTFKIYHKRYKITSIEDIAKCISIIRPMARGNGKNSDLIFDDDWITELSKMLDITYSEADKQRKKLAKDDKELISKLKTIISPQRLKQLMQIKCYGFCKAHAFNYAQLIYCQAYLKFHKPIEFFCAVLNNLNGRIYADWVYFYDALIHNIKIYATKKSDKYIVKDEKHIQPKNGIQLRLFPLSIQQEYTQLGGFTTLKNIEKLNGLQACNRAWKDLYFSTVLRNGELVDEVCSF